MKEFDKAHYGYDDEEATREEMRSVAVTVIAVLAGVFFLAVVLVVWLLGN